MATTKQPGPSYHWLAGKTAFELTSWLAPFVSATVPPRESELTDDAAVEVLAVLSVFRLGGLCPEEAVHLIAWVAVVVRLDPDPTPALEVVVKTG